jgi:hypothetical protein
MATVEVAIFLPVLVSGPLTKSMQTQRMKLRIINLPIRGRNSMSYATVSSRGYG